MHMARPKNPERKPELMAQIIDYLQDRPLADLSFRTLAKGLGVSAYVLVYHFGSREQLINEIAATVEALSRNIRDEDVASWSRHRFRAWVDEGWRWMVQERIRQLRRLGFEFAAQDAVSPNPIGTAQKYFADRLEHTRTWLTAQGLPADEAATEARLLVTSFYGLAYDLVVNDDTDAATDAFEALMRNFWRTLDDRLAPAPFAGPAPLSPAAP
jgi:AcrR family transcriptional regulator